MQTSWIVTVASVVLLVRCHALTAEPDTRNARVVNTAEPRVVDVSPNAHPVIRRLPRVPNPGVLQAAFVEPMDILPVPPGRSGPVFQPAADLSLEQLENMALQSNPTIAQAMARVGALRGKWIQAGLAPNPTVGYVGNEMGNEGEAGQQGGFIRQKLVTGGKLGLDRAIVSQEIMQAEQHVAAQRQRVLTDVRTGYYDVLIAQRKLDLARELVNVSDQAVRTSEDLFHHLQDIPRIGVLQSQIEARNSRIVLRKAENEQAEAWRRLTAVLGRPQLPAEQLAGELEPVEEDLNFDVQLQRLLSQSPETGAAVADLERARWSLQRAFAQVKPDLNVQLAVQHDNATEDTVTSVQVGLPVPIWNRNQGGIRQAQSEILAAERNIDRVNLHLRRRLAAVFREYADSRYQVQMFSSEILPTAKETFDLTTQGYQRGDLNYLTMLTAQRTYFQTNLSYIESLRELWRAKLRMDGLLLEASLRDGSNDQ